MTSIIIEDDLLATNILAAFCQKANVQVLQSFVSPIKAMDYLRNQEVDIIFLDLNLPDLNGFDFLENVNRKKVIITTIDKSQAVKAFEYHVLDFLPKPIIFERFLKAVELAKSNIEKELSEDHFYVNISKRLVKIKTNEINYIEAQGNYVVIHLENKKEIIVHTTLKKINGLLPDSIFVQTHRSFIINFNKIVDIEDSSIVISQKVIPLGKKFRAALLSKLNLLS